MHLQTYLIGVPWSLHFELYCRKRILRSHYFATIVKSSPIKLFCGICS